ncbi:MAG: hypothetical protein HYS43_00910 [Candidatus Liptonbacteria bacterium]|nr:hypothetical protein [Candidatus Liptonbacteria bacterium]
MTGISEEKFRELLNSALNGSYDRALVILTVFRECGEDLTYDVTNVLLLAADQGKAEEVLNILEEHCANPIAGNEGEMKRNPLHCDRVNQRYESTEAMFHRIRETLGIAPHAA